MIALAMAHAIHQRDPRHDFLSDYLSPYSPELVAGETGISAEKIQTLAEEFHQNPPWQSLVAPGIAVSKQQPHKSLCLH